MIDKTQVGIPIPMYNALNDYFNQTEVGKLIRGLTEAGAFFNKKVQVEEERRVAREAKRSLGPKAIKKK